MGGASAGVNVPRVIFDLSAAGNGAGTHRRVVYRNSQTQPAVVEVAIRAPADLAWTLVDDKDQAQADPVPAREQCTIDVPPGWGLRIESTGRARPRVQVVVTQVALKPVPPPRKTPADREETITGRVARWMVEKLRNAPGPEKTS